MSARVRERILFYELFFQLLTLLYSVIYHIISASEWIII